MEGGYYASFEPYKGIDIDVIQGQAQTPKGKKKNGQTYKFITDSYVKYKDKTFSLSKYKSWHEIPGDFSKSYNQILKYKDDPPVYNILDRNCAWLALYILQRSTSGSIYTKIEKVLYTETYVSKTGWIKTRNVLIPNNLFD